MVELDDQSLNKLFETLEDWEAIIGAAEAGQQLLLEHNPNATLPRGLRP